MKSNSYVKVFKRVQLKLDQTENESTLIDVSFNDAADFLRFHKLKLDTDIEVRTFMGLPDDDCTDEIADLNEIDLTNRNFIDVRLRLEKPSGKSLTFVDIAFANLNDFVRFRKFCATPHIQMKTSPPLPPSIDDIDDDPICGSGESDEESAESSDCDSVPTEKLIKRRYPSLNRNEAETINHECVKRHCPAPDAETIQFFEKKTVDAGTQTQDEVVIDTYAQADVGANVHENVAVKSENEIRYKIINDYRSNNKLLYTIDEKQTYTKSWHSDWYDCQVKRCLARVFLDTRTGICSRNHQHSTHNHGIGEDNLLTPTRRQSECIYSSSKARTSIKLRSNFKRNSYTPVTNRTWMRQISFGQDNTHLNTPKNRPFVTVMSGFIELE